jgi:hypothetical protein
VELGLILLQVGRGQFRKREVSKQVEQVQWVRYGDLESQRVRYGQLQRVRYGDLESQMSGVYVQVYA